jgi:hypothetical protein
MPDGKYYRAQAHVCATLALAADDERAAARYNELALEYLARAEDMEPGAARCEPVPPRPTAAGQHANDATARRA